LRLVKRNCRPDQP